jgi:hypothetical protein
MTTGFSGGCHCGAIRYASSADPVYAGHCQCSDCRRFSGTGHSSHLAVPQAAVTITGNARSYDVKADSRNTVGRAFCPNCGAQVYSTNSGMPALVFLRASSLDDPSVFRPQMVVYKRSAPAWDHVDPSLPAFDTMPPGR